MQFIMASFLPSFNCKKYNNRFMKSKQKTIGIFLLTALAVTALVLVLNRKNKEVDDYDWIMW